MKYLNLSRLFIFFFFLVSCHSTEVVLRKSKAQGMTDYSQKPENNDIIHTNISQEAVKHELSKITPLQEKKTTLLNQDLKTEKKNTYTNIFENIGRHQKVNNTSSNQRIQHQTTHYTPNASAKKSTSNNPMVFLVVSADLLGWSVWYSYWSVWFSF